ncbi:hypothetical protein F5887DRAFT_988378 [Amanita rubescens]|nr:hypothetical protein F5887DRAFT_988378 [Amanita rubescens]
MRIFCCSARLRTQGSLTGLNALSFAGPANSNSPLTVMPAFSILSMASRSSSSPQSRDMSSLPIDDDVYQRYANHPIISLELWKEREEPEHEFVVLKVDDVKRNYYRIERRPLKGANVNSKLRGCKAEDTITSLHERDYFTVRRLTDRKIHWFFDDEPKSDSQRKKKERKPDLHTFFAFCNAIRKDPDTEKYTLAQFNCYFFARTLALLIIRHFLQRLYCARISPRNNFDGLTGVQIDAKVDEAMNKTRLWVRSMCTLQVNSQYSRCDYESFRFYIAELNERHCKRVTRLGGNGDKVYDTWNRKKEEIWRRTHSDPTLSDAVRRGR